MSFLAERFEAKVDWSGAHDVWLGARQADGDDPMRGPSGLSKTQREMIAVVVSAESHCPYC